MNESKNISTDCLNTYKKEKAVIQLDHFHKTDVQVSMMQLKSENFQLMGFEKFQ